MEKQNLNVAPTLNEIKQAGFLPRETNFYFSNYKPSGLPNFLEGDYTYCLDIDENLFVSIDDVGNTLLVAIMGEYYKPIARLTFTKEAINKQFEHFGQAAPQWENKRPKVGEVWTDSFEDVQVLELDKVYVKVQVLDNKPNYTNTNNNPIKLVKYQTYKFTIDKFVKYHKKIFNSLEEYYSEKFEMNS